MNSGYIGIDSNDTILIADAKETLNLPPLDMSEEQPLPAFGENTAAQQHTGGVNVFLLLIVFFIIFIAVMFLFRIAYNLKRPLSSQPLYSRRSSDEQTEDAEEESVEELFAEDTETAALPAAQEENSAPETAAAVPAVIEAAPVEEDAGDIYEDVDLTNLGTPKKRAACLRSFLEITQKC